MYISHFVRSTDVLGPGKRFVIWTQGCKKRCIGCVNPEGQPLDRNGFYMSVGELFGMIKASADKLTGLTVSGGEPFLQIDELNELFTLVRRDTSLDIMLYSGYELAELRDMFGNAADDVLALTDIFIDGGYREELNNDQLYRGSSNQNIYFFSGKYKAVGDDILNARKRELEFIVRPDGSVGMVGLPPKKFIEKLGKLL